MTLPRGTMTSRMPSYVTSLMRLYPFRGTVHLDFGYFDFQFSWGVAVAITILNSEKDPLLAISYRPIFLTSCICKVLEKVVNVLLMWFLEINWLID